MIGTTFFGAPARAGKSFEQLAAASRERAFRLAMRLAHDNRDEAEDILQEAYLKAWRSFDSFQSERSFDGWLSRILKNVAIDRYRRRPKASLLSLDQTLENVDGDRPIAPELADSGMGPEQAALQGELADQVAAALARLSPSYAEAVRLCDLDGLSYEEIADRVGCTVGTVRSRIHRGRQQLKELLRPLVEAPQG